MFANVAAERTLDVTLFTDAYMARGSVRTRQPRLTDVLNNADEPFLIIEQALLEEYGSRGDVIRADFAQVNLGAVLFAVSNVEVAPTPELRTPKVAEEALITVPPFKIIGRIHLLPERELREALHELTGAFIPVTDATYWSDQIGTRPRDRDRPDDQPLAGPDPGAPQGGRSVGRDARRGASARSATAEAPPA